MNKKILELSGMLEVDIFGGKATNLSRMIRNSLPVPSGFAVGLDAFDLKGNLKKGLDEVIINLLDSSKKYAVRSSATSEDSDNASWAGQFESFLDIDPDEVPNKVVECHNSAKARARAYAQNMADDSGFKVAVVIQEMVNPEYAGVLFTKDPLTGENKFVTEYVKGIGEELVSGRADPIKISWKPGDKVDAPFDINQLTDLAEKVESAFESPQDIEWAWADNTMWLVQTRPITTIQTNAVNYDLGEVADLFYWGPSRAEPMYMSDFMAAVEKLFAEMDADLKLPNPPSNLVLFDKGRMVWLSNASSFFSWCEKTFEIYEKLAQLDKDISNWKRHAEKLHVLNGAELNEELVSAWYYTELAEFSLYGAEAALAKRLDRFDSQAKQDIWTAFTVPDKPTFLSEIDKELAENKDPAAMAKKYPWIQDGYFGLSDDVEDYFQERLKIVGSDTAKIVDNVLKRQELITRLELSKNEVESLTLARKLAEFMDDRKAWMMQTRRLLKESIGNIKHGWFFAKGEVSLLDKNKTHELWQRYVDFKASTNVVSGAVASNGGKHFVNGEVVVVENPTDSVPEGKILVVPSTSPSYVPLMRKAKALVTDHGGMMSHAAIVAREFNLPCIVGTKQATKVLNDGDKVVLDLVKGEVIR